MDIRRVGLVTIVCAMTLVVALPSAAQLSGSAPGSEIPGASKDHTGPPQTQLEPNAFGVMSGYSTFFAPQWTTYAAGTKLPQSFAHYPYVCVDSSGSAAYYRVQLDLPLGAEVDGAYVPVYDNDASSEWALYISGNEASNSGAAPPNVDDYDSDSTSGQPEWISLTVYPTDMVIREFEDLNGDGSMNLVSYSMELVALPVPSSSSTMCFFGAAVWWHRTISPAPASATFSDVPVGSFGFQHIEALVDSGITAGCGGGNFCPGNTLTRAEMAIFLAKALGLHWPT